MGKPVGLPPRLEYHDLLSLFEFLDNGALDFA